MTKFIKTSGLAVSAIALFAFASAPAQADDMMMMDKGNFQVGIGGFYTQGFAFVDDDSPNGSSDTDFVQNAEIHFNGSTTLDNGVQIGFRVELEANGDKDDDIIDEHYTYIKGDFGKFIIGAENGVGHLAEVTAPYFVAGFASHNNSLTDDILEAAHNSVLGANAVRDAHTSTKLENISGDAYKISYFTPRIAGLQAGASYAPNNNDLDGSDSTYGDIRGNQENIYEISLNYKARMSGLDFEAGGAFVGSESADDGEDPQAWNVGASLSLAGFTFGGNYSSYENLGAVSSNGEYGGRPVSARAAVFTPTDATVSMTDGSQLTYSDDPLRSEEITTWSIGIAYDLGHTVVGFSYTDSEEDLTNRSTSTIAGTADDATGANFMATDMAVATAGSIAATGTEYTEWMVGGTTNLAKGVDVGYFYQMSEAEYNGRSSDASLVGVTLALQF